MDAHDEDGLVEALAGRSELEVLLEQLEELLGEGVTTGDDALEVAAVAGLAARLDADPQALADARRWLAEGGREMVRDALDDVDLDELVEALDNLEGADDHDVEEALSDLDDVVAAAVWAGLADRVRDAGRRTGALIRQVPDPFAFMADTGRQVARSRVLAEDLETHDYWFAIAEADEWSSD
jgi:hypothetical protein